MPDGIWALMCCRMAHLKWKQKINLQWTVYLPITFFPTYQSKELLWYNFIIWGNTAQANSVLPLFQQPWSPQGLKKYLVEELRTKLTDETLQENWEKEYFWELTTFQTSVLFCTQKLFTVFINHMGVSVTLMFFFFFSTLSHYHFPHVINKNIKLTHLFLSVNHQWGFDTSYNDWIQTQK